MPTGHAITAPPLPCDVAEERVALGSRRLRIWRPARPPELHDPDAEHGAAGPVWAQTWTSSRVLAPIVSESPLHGVRVLDLGCGLGVVGVAAAAAGGRVTVSDRSAYALAFARANAEANGLAVEPIRCDWARPAPLEDVGPWTLVLAADVLYDERSAGRLLQLLPRLVAPGGEVWLADPGRRPTAAFIAGAWPDWRVESVPAGQGVAVHRLRPAW